MSPADAPSGAGSVDELAIDARAAEIPRAAEWLERAGRDRAIPPEQVGRLDICLHEALANIVDHSSGADRPLSVRLRLEILGTGDSREALVTVSDLGKAFDPLSAAPRPRPATLAEAVPGGLGLVMIRGFSDTQDYRRTDGANHLTFGVRWTVAR